MEKPAGKIYESTDYLKFKFLKGNRKVKQNKSLENSIIKSGILVPIEVNEGFEVLDGQFRLKVAQKYELVVPYRIAEGLGIQDVIDLNSTTKSWNLNDYIRKYAVDGIKSYLQLQRLIIEFAYIPASTLAAAAMGNTRINSSSTKLTKSGKFDFLNYEEFYQFLKSYQQFIEETGLKGSQQTFFAYFELYVTPKFTNVQLINGFKQKDKRQIEGMFHQGLVLEFFLKAFNYGLSSNSQSAIKYKLNQNGDPIVIEEKNPLLIKE
ncbi:chromosome partitioning protein ParB [Enterococcus devriesei]|uniref:chromosome partitioning protein ParB n=1 Tax=Enterococcus devriesei TaxID=319970 RepID=UPI0036D3AB66